MVDACGRPIPKPPSVAAVVAQPVDLAPAPVTVLEEPASKKDAAMAFYRRFIPAGMGAAAEEGGPAEVVEEAPPPPESVLQLQVLTHPPPQPDLQGCL